MRLTPLDIRQQRFRLAWRGLDRAEVDAFLNLVAAQMENLVREVEDLKEAQRQQKKMLDDFHAREEAIKETMVTAQRVTEEITQNAKKEADIILGRAELDAERLVQRAQTRYNEILVEISELQRQRVQFLAQLRGLIDTHHKLLDISETQAPGIVFEPELRRAGIDTNLK